MEKNCENCFYAATLLWNEPCESCDVNHSNFKVNPQKYDEEEAEADAKGEDN